ncbi:antitoxin MazE7 [Streptomyces avermitilis]|uniref:antitoxin MazE7 n=1 Tax=Streptomyces avermitilis TaxID=33903 RepID=UPI003677EF79
MSQAHLTVPQHTTADGVHLAALAKARGVSLAAYLDDLSQQEEHQALLGRATAAFDRPGFVDAFDKAFGGLPAAPASSRAA